MFCRSLSPSLVRQRLFTSTLITVYDVTNFAGGPRISGAMLSALNFP
jgi:hypothetical protein